VNLVGGEKPTDPQSSGLENKIMHVVIALCDSLNHGFGYSILVEKDGRQLLFTSVDPQDGKDLLTYADALRVAGYYA
jgi:hypothetical protein